MSDDNELRKIRATLVQILGEMRVANSIAMTMMSFDDRIGGETWQTQDRENDRIREEHDP